MNLIKKSLLHCLLFACSLSFGQEQIKAMFYNVLNFPLQAPISRVDDHLEVIIDDYQPDLFMICELNSESGADIILTMMQGLNANYQRAAFVENTSDDNGSNQNDLQNMIYYDNTKFTLLSQTEITTTVRDFNQYTLRLNTVDQDTNPVILNVFVTHLKSSNGSSNQNLRFQQVIEFTNYLETLADDSYVLLGGDLNFYTASENGFQELVDGTNNIILVDPADRVGSWSNNTNFLDVFTQSTRTQTGLGGATGGFDDRFDFIMTSENMLDDSETLYYVDGSYRAYGNNNNPACYNDEINSSDCDGMEFDATIREALYFMSDHLPVTVTLETTETLSISDVTQEDIISFVGGNLINERLSLKTRNSQGSYVVLNTLGQELLKFSMKGLNQIQINASNLASGIYYIKSDQLGTNMLKFIKR